MFKEDGSNCVAAQKRTEVGTKGYCYINNVRSALYHDQKSCETQGLRYANSKCYATGSSSSQLDVPSNSRRTTSFLECVAPAGVWSTDKAPGCLKADESSLSSTLGASDYMVQGGSHRGTWRYSVSASDSGSQTSNLDTADKCFQFYRFIVENDGNDAKFNQHQKLFYLANSGNGYDAGSQVPYGCVRVLQKTSYRPYMLFNTNTARQTCHSTTALDGSQYMPSGNAYFDNNFYSSHYMMTHFASSDHNNLNFRYSAGCVIYVPPDKEYPKTWIGGTFPNSGGERDVTAAMCDNKWEVEDWSQKCYKDPTSSYDENGSGRRQENEFECERDNDDINNWIVSGNTVQENNRKCLHTTSGIVKYTGYTEVFHGSTPERYLLLSKEECFDRWGKLRIAGITWSNFPNMDELTSYSGPTRPSGVGCFCSSSLERCIWNDPDVTTAVSACTGANNWRCQLLQGGSPADDITDTLETERMCVSSFDTEWIDECYEDVGNRVLSGSSSSSTTGGTDITGTMVAHTGAKNERH